MLDRKKTFELPINDAFVVDCETKGLSARFDKNATVYMTCIVTLDDSGSELRYVFADVADAVAFVQSMLEQGKVMVNHNSKFDYSVLKTHGLDWDIKPEQVSVLDTMVMAHCLKGNLADGSHLSLENLAWSEGLEHTKIDIIDEFTKAGLVDGEIKKKAFWDIDWSGNKKALGMMSRYCLQDCRTTMALYRKLAKRFNNSKYIKHTNVLINIDMPTVEFVSQMERNGIQADLNRLNVIRNRLAEKIQATQKELYEKYYLMPKLSWDDEEECYIPKCTWYVDSSVDKKELNTEVFGSEDFEEFPEYLKTYKNKSNMTRHYTIEGVHKIYWEGHVQNLDEANVIGSYCELVELNVGSTATGHMFWLIQKECPELFDRAEKSKKTGRLKLGKEFLKDVDKDMPEHLKIGKLMKQKAAESKCEEIVNALADDDRIHGDFKNCGTRTGRLASTNPNLQNMARPDGTKAEDDWGYHIRSVFNAPAGKKILVADLDRIEVVVVAYYMWKVCGDRRLLDVVTTPGSDVHQFNADTWGCTRTQAKTLIFLLMYGGTEHLIVKRGLAKSIDEARAMIKGVYDGNPALLELKAKVWAKAKAEGFISNTFNFRGEYPELQSNKKWEVAAGERQCFNALIQRTARDVMHSLIIESLPILKKYGAKLCNTIHDEVIVEADEAVTPELLVELGKVWNRRDDVLPGAVVNADWNADENWCLAK